MAKKTRFTVEQHDRLGKELTEMHERFAEIRRELSKAYPQRVYVHAIRAQDSIKKLRYVMEECLHEENQHLPDYLPLYQFRQDCRQKK